MNSLNTHAHQWIRLAALNLDFESLRISINCGQIYLTPNTKPD